MSPSLTLLAMGYPRARPRGRVAVGKGDIEIAAGGKLLVLPQRPYVPTGTLGRAVTTAMPPG